MGAGKAIDLSDCPYGETTGPCAFISRPTNYYYFLAGFVRLARLTRILEIGTNFGGSIMSMSRGLYPEDLEKSSLVTVDLVKKNDDEFKRYPWIKRIHGDSLAPDVIERTVAACSADVELLYIDSEHEYGHVRKNLDIYCGRLKPRFVILDDIRQNDGMRRLWKEISGKYGENAFDASDASIRKGAGFGVINLLEEGSYEKESFGRTC